MRASLLEDNQLVDKMSPCFFGRICMCTQDFKLHARALLVHRYSMLRQLAHCLLLLGVCCVSTRAQLPPARLMDTNYTITGQVTTPSGRPVAHALVKLTMRGGGSRQVLTNEQGRYEFDDLKAGGFFLVANTTTYPEIRSAMVECNTSPLTDHLNVNLTLAEDLNAAETTKPSVISVAEAEQKVPKEARKAFLDGLKFKKDQPDKAQLSFSRAIELFPEYFQALSERGDLYIFQQRLDQATDDFDNALKANPHYGPALRGAGYCRLENRKYAEAIDDFQQSITAEPNNSNTHLLLGIASLELDQREAAKQVLQKALSLGAVRAHIYLGNLYAREGAYKQAADELHAYLNAEPLAIDAGKIKEREAEWRSRSTAP